MAKTTGLRRMRTMALIATLASLMLAVPSSGLCQSHQRAAQLTVSVVVHAPPRDVKTAVQTVDGGTIEVAMTCYADLCPRIQVSEIVVDQAGNGYRYVTYHY